jgi:hypothetical protein
LKYKQREKKKVEKNDNQWYNEYSERFE